MDLLKAKHKGYILLLDMIITSSIFLLVISIIIKNKLANTVSKTISIKHEQNILFTSALSIVKSLLSFDELKKNKNNKKENIIDNNISKNNNPDNNDNKNSNQLSLLYFNFYWNECNKWLKYKFNNNKYNIEGTISIYLSIEDGKFPLKKLYTEYEQELNKEKDTKKNTSNNIKSNDLSDNNKEKEIDLDKEIKKNIFIEKMNIIFKKLEEKSNLFKKIINYNKKNKDIQEDKDSFIIKIINNYFKKGSKKNPISFEDALQESPLNNEIIYGKMNNTDHDKKEYGIQDVFSLSNDTCSLFYLSPAYIEFFSQKPIQLNNETRKKIIDAGKKYFDKIDSNTIINDDLWNTLYANALNIPYQKDFFDIDETQKTYNNTIDIPYSLSALIKIEIMNTVFFGIAYFEKNKKYVKSNENDNDQNQEYLIKSIYILPFE